MAVHDSIDLLFAMADLILSVKFYPGHAHSDLLVSEKTIAYL